MLRDFEYIHGDSTSHTVQRLITEGTGKCTEERALDVEGTK